MSFFLNGMVYWFSLDPPLSEFGQKLAPASRRAANYTLISLLDDRRRHGDHILGTMHTKRGFCLGWLNTDTFLEKCEGGVSASRKKIPY